MIIYHLGVVKQRVNILFFHIALLFLTLLERSRNFCDARRDSYLIIYYSTIGYSIITEQKKSRYSAGLFCASYFLVEDDLHQSAPFVHFYFKVVHAFAVSAHVKHQCFMIFTFLDYHHLAKCIHYRHIQFTAVAWA
jgi:hypothetical protein